MTILSTWHIFILWHFCYSQDNQELYIQLRKHLTESLILSHLNYGDIAFYPLREGLLKRLQHIHFIAASSVSGDNVNSIDSILTLGWLLMWEYHKWHLLKTVHKSLYSMQVLKNEKHSTHQHYVQTMLEYRCKNHLKWLWLARVRLIKFKFKFKQHYKPDYSTHPKYPSGLCSIII